MKNATRLLTFIILLAIVGCKKESPTEQQKFRDEVIAIPIVYMNSFESAQDTVGWQGIFQYMFVNDPAPNCGSKSLKISGGCIYPSASINFDSSLAGHSYRLNCWGKVGKDGGTIFLTTNDSLSFSPPSIYIFITDSVWTHYVSDKILYCPENETLRLGIFSGGDNPAHIFVDWIAIEQID